MKKLVSIFLSALLLVGIAPTLSVFAEEESKEVTLTTVTEYSIVPEGLEKVSVEELQRAGISGGSATVTCKDIGHSLADCDTTYKVVGDKISLINTTVTINDPNGGHILEGKSDFGIINPSRNPVYSAVSFVLPPGTYRSEMWGKVQGGKGTYTVTNVKSRNFKMSS
ncbi:hypothetical protein OCF64_23395 [Bacillus wiedmannii]|uniref:hypothetical protein n=1 Tax=Bacillus wiedmannii TaxID=1890302 RepID=UPI0021CF6098|nr:hypothetical protein [Bacillus wiedmannii]MCU5684715.1 hypothetical protein [Bacillus wiedmannii]